MTHVLTLLGEAPLPDLRGALNALGLGEGRALGPGAAEVSGPLALDREALRAHFAPLGVEAVPRTATPERTAPQLVVFDMDSTLIQVEVIDELARLHGIADEVAAITRRAMNGELDFEGSLRARVALLEGLEEERALGLAAALPLQHGAERLVAVLRALGVVTAVFSGGFTFAADVVRARLRLDAARANVLEAADGKLTGQVIGDVVTPERKAEYLRAFADAHGIPVSATVAVGDGANDALMLEAAGLGVAFHAKPFLRARADARIDMGGLDRLLYLFGLDDAAQERLAASSRSA
ncbi:MAG: phosphoserine phosphatase SerB [Myxococcota bacterium]